jgi:hypothetical protein
MEILLSDDSKYGIHQSPNCLPDSISETLSKDHYPEHKGKT